MGFFDKLTDAFTDHAAEDQRRTDELYNQVSQAYRTAGIRAIDLEECVESVLQYWEADEEKSIPEPLRTKMADAGFSLLSHSGIFTDPVRPGPDLEEQARARDWFEHLLPIFRDFPAWQLKAENVLLNIFHSLLVKLPDVAFGASGFGGSPELSFSVPARQYFKKPVAVEIADRMLAQFFRDEVQDTPLFSDLRGQVWRNMAGMEERYRIPEGRLTTLEDMNPKHDHNEFIPLALRGLFLDDLFNFSLPMALEGTSRFKHQYVLGKTGSGKSVLLRYQIAQDIQAGHGVVVITPERQLIEDALSYVPPERHEDVVYFDAADARPPVLGFNPFANNSDDPITQKAGELEAILVRTLGDMGVKMMPVLSNTIYALLQFGGSFADIPDLLDPWDDSFRARVVPKLDRRTRGFFEKYEKSRYYKEVYEPIINRLDTLLRPPLSETLTINSLDFPTLLNQRQSIVLCDVSRLRGFQAEVTGMLLLSNFQQVFFQRDFIPEKDRLPYFFYMDEFQTYATSSEQSLKDFLTRARKYQVGIVMAHQNIRDIPEILISSIFGNCGTLFGMLMSAEDSKRFTRESQLGNFGIGDADDAAQQLQNFRPGQAAVCTPEIKKAQVVQVPEFPPYAQNYDQIPEIKQLCKERLGKVEASYIPDEEELTVEPDLDMPRAAEPDAGSQDEEDWDDLGYKLR